MTWFIMILIILVFISTINNFIMYKKTESKINCPNEFISYKKDNLKFRNITFFYKDKIYEKCKKNDYKDKIDSDNIQRYQYDVIIDDLINYIKKKYKNKIYIIENNNNNTQLNISDQDFTNINTL